MTAGATAVETSAPSKTGAPAEAASASIVWTWKRFERLSSDDVYDLLALRSRVFVVEQQCVFLDPDGSDRAAWHLLGRAAGPATSAPLVAYLRCLDPGVHYREPSIGRVVTDPEHRAGGLGRSLMLQGLARTAAAWPADDIVINAQARLTTFYRSLGFEVEGPPYDEDGIEHVAMRRAAVPPGPAASR